MMLKKLTHATIALAATGLSFNALAAGPNPDEVYVNNIVHAGTGCPIGTVATDISEDAKAFTILFDEYLVEAGPGVPRSANRRFCQLTVNLHVPQGWSYTIFNVDYAGYADLDRGTMGIQKSTYYFQGSGSRRGVTLQTRMRGPYNDDYTINDRLGIRALVWSPCGVNRALNIKTSLQARARRNASALMTIDSIDGEMIHRYGIKWKRCR